MLHCLILVNFFKFGYFSEHRCTLRLNQLNLLFSFRDLLLNFCNLQLLLLSLSFQSRSLRVLLIKQLLRALLLLSHVLVLLLLLIQSELMLLELAFGLLLLVLDGFDALLVSQFCFGLLLGHDSEALLHLVDLVVDALVVPVLGAQTLDLSFQLCDKLFLLLNIQLQTKKRISCILLTLLSIFKFIY